MSELGGSGRIDEIRDKVIEILSLQDNVVDFPHGDGSRTKIEYELAWVRSLLKYIDFLKNTSMGVWVLTKIAEETELELEKIKKMIKNYWKKRRELKKKEEKEEIIEDELDLDEDVLDDEEVEGNWRDKLIYGYLQVENIIKDKFYIRN